MNVTENRIYFSPDKFLEIIAANGLNVTELSRQSGCNRVSIYRILDQHYMTRKFYQRLMLVVDISDCTRPSTTDIKQFNDLYAKIKELERRVEVLEQGR